MAEWWESLSLLLKTLYSIAVFASTILIIQTIQIMLGFGEGAEGMDVGDTSGLEMPEGLDMDLDTDISAADGDFYSGYHDGTVPGDFDILRLFSFQSIVAFMTVFSWMSISCINSGMNELFALILGFVFGFIAMYGVAKLIKFSRSLASSGNINLKNALGKSARVYLPIRANGKNQGKVLVTLQERMIEQDAITDEDFDLPSGTAVKIVDLRGNLLVVEKE